MISNAALMLMQLICLCFWFAAAIFQMMLVEAAWLYDGLAKCWLAAPPSPVISWWFSLLSSQASCKHKIHEFDKKKRREPFFLNASVGFKSHFRFW